jgi:hypothetical protein
MQRNTQGYFYKRLTNRGIFDFKIFELKLINNAKINPALLPLAQPCNLSP